MASSAAKNTSPLSGRWDLVLPVGIIASVLVILVPLPAALMDVLLAANITLAVLMLLVTISVRTPLELSVFPSLLLAATLGRLVLNIATTRLILSRAETEGLAAAGGVVRSFGEFVAGDRVVVGLVIFSIIVLIQFVVITKGATRISEVAARFALEGLPGKQMAIDADLQANVINESQAARRREDIAAQADFYAAMDGASKFVRGDAIAGLAITFINIIGGLLIGTLEAGMSVTEAGGVFTRLTIGDGLVSQVPALLISLAAGLLITRSQASTNLPLEVLRQLFTRPQALAVAGAFLGVLVFTSLPRVPLLLIGGGCMGLALTMHRRDQRAQEEQQQQQRAAAQPAEKPERIEELLLVEPMELEIGVGLIRLADPQRGGNLLERIQHVRKRTAGEIGIILPKVRIRDNMRLDQGEYQIKITGVPVARGHLRPGRLLALPPDDAALPLDGPPTTEPAFGTPAVWIDPADRERAEALGCSVVDAVTVLATHLVEIVRGRADELLTRDAAAHLIEELRRGAPKLVGELIPDVMSLSQVHQVLRMLLAEGLPIRQLETILQTLGDEAPRRGDDLPGLAHEVRRRLAGTLSTRYRGEDGKLHVVTLAPELEQRIRAAMTGSESGPPRLSATEIEHLCTALERELGKLTARRRHPVVLVDSPIRNAVQQLARPRVRRIVLGIDEITADTLINPVGQVEDFSAAAGESLSDASGGGG